MRDFFCFPVLPPQAEETWDDKTSFLQLVFGSWFYYVPICIATMDRLLRRSVHHSGILIITFEVFFHQWPSLLSKGTKGISASGL